jgi:DNA polymerase-3 subunit delta'
VGIKTDSVSGAGLSWKGVFGQETTKSILEELIISSKIPHSFLFAGPEGCGKYNLSISFARALNQKSLNLPDMGRLNHLIGNLTEPYVKFILPLPRGKNETDRNGPLEKLSADDLDLLQNELEQKINNPYYKIKIPKANTIKINSIREIIKFISLNYSDVAYRIILISDAHLMNEESQNALLKNLEEPPSGVIFILMTPYPELLRETIISRCWRVNFQPLEVSVIKDILIKYFNVDTKTASAVAPFANGSVTNALDLLNHDFNLLQEKTILILRYSLGGKFNSALKELNTFLSEKDNDALRLLIQMLITWLNDVQKQRLNLDEYFFNDYKDTLEKFNARFAGIRLDEIIFKLDKFASIIRSNINPNIICLNIVLELASLTNRLKKSKS